MRHSEAKSSKLFFFFGHMKALGSLSWRQWEQAEFKLGTDMVRFPYRIWASEGISADRIS